MSYVSELAKMTNRSEGQVYYLARKLGRLPTVDEVLNVKNGRPKKQRTDDIKELAEATGRSRMTVYKFYWKLGRLPTKEELLSSKRGRKPKYKK